MPRQVDIAGRMDAVGAAVRAVAAHEGFGAVTIRRIAAEIGASTSVVTHYVDGRDELIRAVAAREVAARTAELDALADARRGGPGLRAVVEWAVLGQTDPTHRFWLALVLGARSDRVLRAELDRFNARWDAVLRRLVAELDVPHDPDALLDAIDVVVDGTILVGFDDPDPWPADRRRRAVDLLLAPWGL